MITVGNIVTLENGIEYLLLEELEKNGVRYVYAVKTLEDETPTDDYLIFETIQDGDDEFLKEINDRELYDELLDEFSDLVADKILDADLENEESEDKETE